MAGREGPKKVTGSWVQGQNSGPNPLVVEAVIEERLKKKKSALFKKACKAAVKTVFSTVGLFLVNIAIMCIGGLMFMKLEIENEVSNCQESSKNYFQSENTTLLLLMDIAQQIDGNTALSDEQKSEIAQKFGEYLGNFSLAVLDSGYRYTVNCDELTENPIKWSYTASLIFALTIQTTIGYGQIAPGTNSGKLACIVYALFAMPIFMPCLANIGGLLANGFKSLYSFVCCCGCRKKKEKKITEKDKEYAEKAAEKWRLDQNTGRPIPPSEEEDIVIDGEDDFDDDEEESGEALTVPLTISVLLYAVFILIGGVIFVNFDDGWTFLDALYYSTITATTIGFGDLVPSVTVNSPEGVAKFTVMVIYVTFSVAAISMVFSLITDEVTAKFEWIGEKLAGKKKEEEDQEDTVEEEVVQIPAKDVESGKN